MKKPFFTLQYEQDVAIPSSYTEIGSIEGAKLDVDKITNLDARKIAANTNHLPLRQMMAWIKNHESELSPSTLVVPMSITDAGKFESVVRNHPKNDVVVLWRALHTVYKLDRLLSLANESLSDGGYLFCHSRTAVLKRKVIMHKYPKGINYVVVFSHYLWHRVCPKLRLTKKLYYRITGGTNRTFNRVELLGRLYHAGFEVIDEGFRFGEFFVVAQKAKSPIYGDTPSVSPIIKLNRVGKDGKMIGVYKFRTMYSYSEYIQPYIYQYQNLATGGKFANDYRVNFWGKLFRATWLDEFPMVINVLKGQMKLVGVRPLSRHYFSLYSPEMQQLRVKVKPGLLPPFYYEDKVPETLEEIQDSERRYTEAYLKHPILTDWRYFWGIVGNIFFKHRKSQ